MSNRKAVSANFLSHLGWFVEEIDPVLSH